MVVVEDMRTAMPINVAPPFQMESQGNARQAKREGAFLEGCVRKKVRFLSEIMTGEGGAVNESETANHGAQVVPTIGTVETQECFGILNSSDRGADRSIGSQLPPGYGTGRRLTIAEMGKLAVPEQDPIIDAVRRAIMGGGIGINEGGQREDGAAAIGGAQAQHANTAAQRPTANTTLLRTKCEFREKHPAKLGIHPDEPIGCDVMGFHDKMARCSHVEKQRKWYCHTHPYKVELTGDLIETVFDRDGDPEVEHMVTMWRLLRKEDAKLFRGLPERFRVIPDFRLGDELMEAERSSDLDFEYIATMIDEENTGVRIVDAKNIMLLLKYMDSWAVYSIDLKKKSIMVMDPVETEEPRHEVEAKHQRNAIRVLSNLRRCIHECIPGSSISSAGWCIDYNTGMHTCCEREESWIYGMHYLREYTGGKVPNLSDGQISYLAKSLVYQLLKMKENRAVLPYCMRDEDGEED